LTIPDRRSSPFFDAPASGVPGTANIDFVLFRERLDGGP